MSGPGPLRPARPTLRCLREDLGIEVPPVTAPLDEIDHPVPAKPSEQFVDEDAKHERIRSVDDHVLFKAKVQRWRGAVWLDAGLPWLVAAGRREDGAGGRRPRDLPRRPDHRFRPEYALPERDLLPAEQAWSNLMDPRAAAPVLDDEEG
ncbi:hypothetical protein [Streptomyces sp. AC550_RSS872]|uniref:hypothetical protein n=1 Tax=Streptomyces sp. AC550_RSS872 TaxID=2823689 RepID=UPI0027E3CF3F|nr:hypothetical protein [Streptomyces sp. AC550_RSS872]